MYENAPPLRPLVRTWLPEELEDVIASCLAKEVDKRPADARALATRLRAIHIPDEHAWTEARALGWWRAWQPPAPAPSVPSAEIQVLVPRRSEKEIVHHSEAATVVEPSKR
jgi:hypothetical protein